MTQREYRTYRGKNGKEYKIETINTDSDDINNTVTKEYSRHRMSIKEFVDIFLFIWNDLNPESAFASFEDFEKTLMELNGYSLTGEQGMLYMYNFLQTTDVLFSLEFIDEEMWNILAAHSIAPFFVIASEIRRSKSYLDDVMILTERIKELEGGKK